MQYNRNVWLEANPNCYFDFSEFANYGWEHGPKCKHPHGCTKLFDSHAAVRKHYRRRVKFGINLATRG